MGRQALEIPPEGLGEAALHQPAENRPLITEAGPIAYQTPKADLPKSRRAFFPLEKMGMCIDDELSPAMQKIVVLQGTRQRGFRKAGASLADNGHVLTAKHVERETERCGACPPP